MQVIKENAEFIRNVIRKSVDEGREYGLLFCQLNGVHLSDIYSGEERSISLGGCSKGRLIGSFHTHPHDKDLKPRHSVSDILISLAKGEDFSCVGIRGNRLECIMFKNKDLMKKYDLLGLEREEEFLRDSKNIAEIEKFKEKKEKLINEMIKAKDIEVERFQI
jgi:hypothetical protein